MTLDTLSTSTFSNMDRLLSPSFYGELAKTHTSITTISIPSGMDTNSRFSKDCEWGFTLNGPVIRCFAMTPRPSNQKSCSHTKSGLNIPNIGYHFPDAIIKCAVELPVAEKSVGYLILGLDSGSAGGYIVIFDPTRGTPLRWIQTSAAVESLVVINDVKETASSNLRFAEAMRFMEGVIGVGFDQGDFSIVDLALDDLRVRFQRENFANYKPIQLENTFQLLRLDVNEDAVEARRLQGIAQHQLICLDFHTYHHSQDESNFDYCGPRGQLIQRFMTAEVSVSALHYVAAIGSILVGFNFGAFQIWNLRTLQLQYSSPIKGWSLPIYSFEFQIPTDDPRNFCYIWVLSGSQIGELMPASMQLFALDYEDVTNCHDQLLYNDLKTCVRRLEFNLGDTYVEEESDSAKPIRPIRLWTFGHKLLFVAWETELSAYVGIFDLDQWYSEHTTAAIPIRNTAELCPFWVLIPFQTPPDQPLCDIRLEKNSMHHWTNIHRFNPKHLYPTSITFQAIALTSEGTFCFEHFGIQEKALRLIQKDGGHLMGEPNQLKQICDFVGLESEPFSAQDLSQQKLDQYSILSSILEATRPSLILQLANSWLDGSYENLGLNLHLIMEWLHHLAYETRRSSLPHWQLLLNSSPSSQFVPPETTKFLHYSHFVWTQEKSLLWAILRGIQEPEERYLDLQFGVEKLVQYSASLLILHEAQVLPYSDTEDDFSTKLKAYYDTRRKQVQLVIDKCSWIHPEERGGHSLLVDYLFEHFEIKSLKEEMSLSEEEHFYPFSHPGHFLNFFLHCWADIPPKFISRIIFYYMLDVLEATGRRDNLGGDFETVMDLSEDEQAKVEILWKIDHGDLTGGLAGLANVRINDEEEGFPWSAAIVCLAAQGAQKPILNILSTQPYPAKISRFALRLALELEPRSSELLRGRILQFSNEEDTFLNLLAVADAENLLEPLILGQIYREGDEVQSGVEVYLQRFPKSLANQMRLFKFYLRTKRISDSISMYKEILKQFPDRRYFAQELRIDLENTEIGLKNLLVVAEGPWQEVQIPKPRTKSLPQPKEVVTLKESGLEMIPGLTPLSPLKRFQGKIKRQSGLIRSPLISSSDENNRSSDEEPFLAHLLQTPPVKIKEQGLAGAMVSPTSSTTSLSPQRSSIKRKARGRSPLRNHLLRTRFLDTATASLPGPLPKESEIMEQTVQTICSDSSPDSAATGPFSVGSCVSESEELSSESEQSPLFKPNGTLGEVYTTNEETAQKENSKQLAAISEDIMTAYEVNSTSTMSLKDTSSATAIQMDIGFFQSVITESSPQSSTARVEDTVAESSDSEETKTNEEGKELMIVDISCQNTSVEMSEVEPYVESISESVGFKDTSVNVTKYEETIVPDSSYLDSSQESEGIRESNNGKQTSEVSEHLETSVQESSKAEAVIEKGKTGDDMSFDTLNRTENCGDTIMEESLNESYTAKDTNTSTESRKRRRSNSSNDGDVSFGMMTRSRSRHMSDASFLAQNERIFLGFSPDLLNRSSFGRAQSEPIETEGKVKPTRRKSKGFVTEPEPKTTTTKGSRSVAPSLESDIGPPATKKRRGKAKATSANTSLNSTILDESLETSSILETSTAQETDLRPTKVVTDTSQDKSSRAKSEEPIGTTTNPPTNTNRRRSYSLPSNKSLLDETLLEEEVEECSLLDTSYSYNQTGRRPVFDYLPGLSTVLEVSETSEGNSPVVSTPMTRARRRSMQASQATANLVLHAGSTSSSTNSTPSVARKRGRLSIAPIVEEDEGQKQLRQHSTTADGDGSTEGHDTPMSSGNQSVQRRTSRKRN